MSGLGTDLKSLVYLSNTPVIVLLFFFFVGMPPIRDLVSHSPNQSGDAELFQSHLFSHCVFVVVTCFTQLCL